METQGLATVQPDLELQVGWQYQTRDEWLQAQWDEATLAWLQAKLGKTGSQQTRRAYEFALRQFAEFARKFRPNPDGSQKRIWEVGGADVIAWQAHLRKRELAETTINLRLAGVSSFFEFVSTKYSLTNPRTGQEMFLVNHNPVARAERAKIDPYDKADGLAKDEVYSLLRRINLGKVEGVRDFALVVTFIATGRRCSEVLRLRWGDITEKNGVIFYKWGGKGDDGGTRGKGGKGGVNELTRFAYDAIQAYLKASGRLDTITADDYVFVALSDVAARLPNVTGRPDKQPLSGSMANRIIKKCARRAGLDAKRIHVHTLRHTAADLRIEMSNGDLLALQEFLQHASVDTTRIYVTKRKRERDPLWAQVAAFFEMV